MKALTDEEFEDLIFGYLNGQFREWFLLRGDLYYKLKIEKEAVLENLIYRTIEYLVSPLRQYAEEEIPLENLEEQAKRAIVLVLRVYASKNKTAANSIEKRKELLWLHIQKVFFDFESPQEFRGIIKQGCQIAIELDIPLKEAFSHGRHYYEFVKKIYSAKAFQIKLEGMLAMFSLKKLTKDFQIEIPLKKRKNLSEFSNMPAVLKLVVEERIKSIFTANRA